MKHVKLNKFLQRSGKKQTKSGKLFNQVEDIFVIEV